MMCSSKNLSETRAAEYRNKMIGFTLPVVQPHLVQDSGGKRGAPLFYQGVSRKKRHELAMEYLEKLGLKQWANHYPNEMSGGQKQRVAIARALAMEPEVLLFDEPTSALDPQMVGEVLEVMRKLAKEGLTMIIVTHEMAFARDVSTHVVYMANGVIVEEGTPADIFANPQREQTMEFLGRFMHEK